MIEFEKSRNYSNKQFTRKFDPEINLKSTFHPRTLKKLFGKTKFDKVNTIYTEKINLKFYHFQVGGFQAKRVFFK